MIPPNLSIFLKFDEPKDFIELWSSHYTDKHQYLYDDNIGKTPYSEAAIMSLYEWKNSGKLSEVKKASVNKNYVNQQHNGFPQDIKNYLYEHCNGKSNCIGGAIWSIFWLHCLDQKYPIYDQLVHRAMCHITGNKLKEHDKCDDRQKVDLYLNSYRPFIEKYFSGIELIKVDKALWMFGKFLKKWPMFMNPASVEG